MAQDTIEKPSYVGKLIAAIEAAMPGAEVDVEQVRGDRYRFIIVWAGFDDMGHPERQDIVWDLIERTLDKTDLLKVTMALTLGVQDLPEE